MVLVIGLLQQSYETEIKKMSLNTHGTKVP